MLEQEIVKAASLSYLVCTKWFAKIKKNMKA